MPDEILENDDVTCEFFFPSIGREPTMRPALITAYK